MPADRDLDALVADLVAHFALSARYPGWRAQVRDLQRVLAADYDAAVDRHVRSGALPIAELTARARSVLPDFNQRPLRFDEGIARLVEAPQGPRLRLHTSRRGRMGDPLRGFYHRPDATRTLVWVNLAHLPTAVAATFAHEVGHWLGDEVHGLRAGSHAFFNVDYAAHLDDAREVFADAFATLAAYPHPQAVQLFERRRWPFGGNLRRQAQANVRDVHRYLVREYGGDLSPQSRVPVRCRFLYMIGMIHFARLRAAILHVVDA